MMKSGKSNFASYKFIVLAFLFLLAACFFLVFQDDRGITGAIVVAPTGTLNCTFVNSTSCPTGAKVLALSAGSNAHAELANESNYNGSICCVDETGGNTLSSVGGTTFLRLSSSTNAHVEQASNSNYNFTANISADNATMFCTVNSTGAGSCPSGKGCVVTLSALTNAHAANCTPGSAYNITVCCAIGGLTTVYLAPLSGIAANLTADGSINGSLINGSNVYETQTVTFLNTTSNQRYLEFTGLFNSSNVDARTLVIEENDTAVAVNTSAVLGFSAVHTLFVKNNSAVNNVGVRVCPAAESLGQVVPGCAGEKIFILSFPQTRAGITVSIDGADYRIAGLTTSGAELASIVNSTIVNSNVTNSSLVNANVTDSNVTNSTKINSTIINSTVEDSYNVNCTIIDGVEINTACTRTDMNDSNVQNSSLLIDMITLNATIFDDFCLSGTIIYNGETFNCPISLADILSPPQEPEGPGGGGASSSASASASAAASASASAGTGSGATTATAKSAVSVEAPSFPILPECVTVPITTIVSERPPIPAGFELIGQPEFRCVGDIVDFTITVPDTYTDLRAIRCRGGLCQEVVDVEESKEDILCGNVTLNELMRRKIREVRKEIAPVEIPVNFTDSRFMTGANPYAILDEYELRLSGDVPRKARVRARLVQNALSPPPNPSALVLSAPLHLTFEEGVNFGMHFEVAYPDVKGIDLETLTFAMYVDGEWILLGGEVDRKSQRIRYDVPRLADIVHGDELTIAIIGVIGEGTVHSQMELQYSDGESRRALILLPGLTANTLKFGSLIDSFRAGRQPWQIWVFSYPYNESIESNALSLAEHLSLHDHEFDDLYFLGHSLGGLIAEQAVWDAYNSEGQGYEWFDKVRKIIPIGTPNKGSPTVEVYHQLFSNLFNLSTSAKAFNLNARAVDDLANGKFIPPVPGIDYEVIVGTRSIPFTQRLFDKINDGVLTPESGYTIGDVKFNNPCENFYQINITHVDLDEHPTALRVIQRILNEDLADERPGTALLGYNKYMRISARQCDPADSYFIIGRPIPEEAAFDPLLCKCGNGVCGEGETPDNCPVDCARVEVKETLCTTLDLASSVLLIFLLLTTLYYVIRRYGFKVRKPWSFWAVFVIMAFSVIVMIVQYLGCEFVHPVKMLSVICVFIFMLLSLLVSHLPRHAYKKVAEVIKEMPKKEKKRAVKGKPKKKKPVKPVELAIQEKFSLFGKSADDLIAGLPEDVKRAIEKSYRKEKK